MTDPPSSNQRVSFNDGYGGPMLSTRLHKGDEVIVDAKDLVKWMEWSRAEIERLRAALERLRDYAKRFGDDIAWHEANNALTEYRGPQVSRQGTAAAAAGTELTVAPSSSWCPDCGLIHAPTQACLPEAAPADETKACTCPKSPAQTTWSTNPHCPIHGRASENGPEGTTS